MNLKLAALTLALLGSAISAQQVIQIISINTYFLQNFLSASDIHPTPHDHNNLRAGSIPIPNSRDNSSYGNIDTIVTTHFDLNLTVNFTTQSISGNNTLTLKAVTQASQVVLDYQGLSIVQVWDLAT